jgi:hypothetical protein
MKIGEMLNDYSDEKSSSVVTDAISVLIFVYCFMGFRYIQKQDTGVS